MTTEIDIKPLICLKLLGEVFLLWDILLVGFKVFVDTLFGGLLVNFQMVNPGVLPVWLCDVLRCTECRHIKHEIFRLRNTVSTPSCLDRSWVVENMIMNGGGGDARKWQGYTSMNQFPDAVWDFLVQDYIARDFVSFLEHHSMTIERNTLQHHICGDRGCRFSAANGDCCFSRIFEIKIDDIFEVCGR